MCERTLTPELCIELADCLDVEAYIPESEDYTNHQEEIALYIQTKLMILILNRHGLSLNMQLNPCAIDKNACNVFSQRECLPEFVTSRSLSSDGFEELYHAVGNSYIDMADWLENQGKYIVFSLLGTIMSSWKNFNELTDEDISEGYDYYEDYLLEFLLLGKDSAREQWINSLTKIAKECALCEKKGYTHSKLVQEYAKKISDSYFNKKIPVEFILKNLSFFTKVFSAGDSNCEVYCFLRKDIPAYLQNRNLLSNFMLKKTLDKALDIFFDPVPWASLGTYPICGMNEDYAFMIICLNSSDEEPTISFNSFRPFWTMACNIIDILLPIALKQLGI